MPAGWQDGHDVHHRAAGLGYDEDLRREGALVAGEVVHHDAVAGARRGGEPKPSVSRPFACGSCRPSRAAEPSRQPVGVRSPAADRCRSGGVIRLTAGDGTSPYRRTPKGTWPHVRDQERHRRDL
jgi:hypothetical protein